MTKPLFWPAKSIISSLFLTTKGRLVLGLLLLMLVACAFYGAATLKQSQTTAGSAGISAGSTAKGENQTSKAQKQTDKPTTAAQAPKPTTPSTPAQSSTVSSGGGTSGTGSPASSSGGGSTAAPACSGGANTPGGPDGRGGCFPGANNTGPNAAANTMSAYTGSCTITTPNTVIDSKVINCDIQVAAAGLVIKNSYIYGSVDQADGVNAAFTIQDSFMNGANPYACINCGVGYRNFTILRSEIIGTNRGAYCESTCLIQDTWIHGTNLEPSPTNLAHASAIRVEQYATVVHNTLACDYAGPFPNEEIGCSANMSGYPDFAPIKHNTIDGNLFVANPIGLGFCAYGGGTNGKPYSNDPTNATYVVFKNNVFQRGSNGKCGTWGAVTDFISGRTGNVWSNNTWDNGTLVDPA